MVQQQLHGEALVRKYIDKHLEETGWKILKIGDKVPSSGNYALPELEVKGKFADYALYIDGKLWAIIEAKKEGCETVEHALVQAIERYANPLRVNYVYAANTKLDRYQNTVINLIFRDLRVEDSKHHELFTFHTPRDTTLIFYIVSA
jgi:type I site-specific restriction endonuclease